MGREAVSGRRSIVIAPKYLLGAEGEPASSTGRNGLLAYAIGWRMVTPDVAIPGEDQKLTHHLFQIEHASASDVAPIRNFRLNPVRFRTINASSGQRRFAELCIDQIDD